MNAIDLFSINRSTLSARIYSVLALVKLVIAEQKKIKPSSTAKSCLSIPSKSVPYINASPIFHNSLPSYLSDELKGVAEER